MIVKGKFGANGISCDYEINVTPSELAEVVKLDKGLLIELPSIFGQFAKGFKANKSTYAEFINDVYDLVEFAESLDTTAAKSDDDQEIDEEEEDIEF